MTTFRERILSEAASALNLGARAETAEAYLDLIAPHESAQVRKDFLRKSTSGCGLVVRGLWRRCGVQHKLLQKPYRTGMAMVDVQTIGREANAWMQPTANKLPKPGDTYYLLGPEHVGTIIEVCQQSDGSLLVASVDGGQRAIVNANGELEANYLGDQSIITRHRRWMITFRGAWQTRGVDDQGSGVRALYGWVDADKLGEKFWQPFGDCAGLK
jgi:hypothetical protein